MQDVQFKSHSMHVVCLVMRDPAGCEIIFCLQSWQQQHVLLVVGRLRCVVHVAVMMCSMKLVADVDVGANQQNRHV